jgi:hypothetical protein
MYQQIRVDDQDCRFQRILWRKSTEEPNQDYELCTVIYDTASAPFLATRCLQQLAQEEARTFLEMQKLLRHFYVDDCISGTQTLEEALQIQEQLIQLLKSGRFLLCKWCSNHAALLRAISPEFRETQLPLQWDGNDHVKTLGLMWHPAQDQFQVISGIDKLDKSTPTQRFTKRTVWLPWLRCLILWNS